MAPCRLWLALAALFFAGPTFAHESLPLVVSVTERASDVYAVKVRPPPSIASQPLPKVRMPAGCANAAQERLYQCTGDMDGKLVSWSFAGATPAIPTMVRFEWLNGEVRTRLAPPGVTQLEIPRKESALAVSRQYLAMGVEHILGGYDHLLFLACLLWIAGNFRRIFLTVTGFTLAHSLTLGLSALSIIHVPMPPTEAAIALSILFLAREIAVDDRESLVWRHPAVVSSLFGLLHGLGFASALREIGLPQTQLLAGLLSFNLGVEMGQLAVVALFLSALALLRINLAETSPTAGVASALVLESAASRVLVLALGMLSAFWFIERMVALF